MRRVIVHSNMKRKINSIVSSMVNFLESEVYACSLLIPYSHLLNALMLAAQSGHTETVKALIEACADVNLRIRASFKSHYNYFISMCGSSIVLFHCSS